MKKLGTHGKGGGHGLAAPLACLAAAVCAALPSAVRAAESQPLTIFANAPESYLWHSIPAGDTTVYWDMPETAHTATITIEGAHYRAVQSGLTGESCVLSLPRAANAREDVFKVTLAFDDGSSQTAYLGAVTGLGTAGTATSPRVKLETASTWAAFQDYAAIALLQGATALTVNGAPLPDLDGNVGWRLVKHSGASQYDIAMTLDGETNPLLASVTGFAGGTMIIFR
jgi:hypothetical protein